MRAMAKKLTRRSDLTDRVVAQRIAGRSEHAIAKNERISSVP